MTAMLRVAVPVPLRRLFDYLPAPDCDVAALKRGQRVQVPFGRQTLVGVLWQVVTETAISTDKLHAADAVLDAAPLLSDSVLELCEFAAQYYQHPLGDVLTTALPVLLRASGRTGSAPKGEMLPGWRLTELGWQTDPDSKKKAPRQRALLLALRANEHGLLQAELAREDFSPALMRQLAKAGLIEKFLLAPADDHVERRAAFVPAPATISLNPDQLAAIAAVGAKLGQFAPFLLDGVTGSGKTEVYMALIDAVRARGEQALVLIPEIGLTPQTEARFRARFGDDIAVLHSGLTDKQRWQAWERARTGAAQVVIGTRSALFVSLPKPGLIVVDEEHDLSFKQQEGFRYHARDLAVWRAQREQIPIVLGSATPALETLRNARSGRYTRLQLSGRAGVATMPLLRCLDIRGQQLDEGLSGSLLAAMQRHLDAGAQVLLFLNRRGFAPTLMCHDCGWVADCARCNAHYTLHQKIGRLRCHHCGSERAKPKQCPSCKSQNLLPLGAGTERVEQAIQRHFPEQPIARIDRDTTRGRDSMSRWVEAIRARRYRILLGTQMLAKGHDFPDVTLSALLDVDGALFASDFRAPERLAQLVTQVAGRAGRGEKRGEVLLQTHHPEHPLLTTLMSGGYPAFAELALAERENQQLPPFGPQVLLRAEAPQMALAEALLKRARDQLAAAGLMALGPVPAPQALRAGRYRAQLLIEGGPRSALQAALTKLLPQLETWPEARKARWSVDVDPQEMA
ncbi:primosomal protein N' [Permianibacter sp. IMCC34836]|uniref:primosomal protein N' n=1 Tax=Permianibacter fluminis TaxID=2738515 RepID=UPI0015578EDB|nr:primosomal protein N' [Permianibacter fluminis]NQD36126.1 primosomal protein N' [Permianibacter fluminis]